METIATNFLAAFSVRYLLQLFAQDHDVTWRESGLWRRTFDISGRDAEHAYAHVRKWLNGPR